MSKLKFFIEGLKHFREVGTITQSGKALSKSLASFIEADKSVVVLEIGAGDGPITQAILDRMHPQSQLISIELNERLYQKLAQIKDPRFTPVLGNAENVIEILAQHGITQVDHVASAIPFIVIPTEKAKEILQTCQSLLKPSGYWLQIHYAKTLMSLYKSVFGNVEAHFTLLNVPPAYVFVSKNNS